MTKITEALDILKQFNVPKKQQNERSALTLLALISLKEKDPWKKAKKTLIRIHDIMIFIKKQYKKKYAENTRETIRRQTLHQFEQEVGIVERNADDPLRVPNSPKTVWSVSDDTLKILKIYGSKKWKKRLPKFLKKIRQTAVNYNVKRKSNKLVMNIDGSNISFSPGKHNELQIDILNEFRKNFCKSSKVVYVGDTAHKMLYKNEKLIKKKGFKIEKHGILPDIVIFDKKKKRLYLIEAVTTHGPVSTKRFIELTKYFSKLKLKLIFVSAFPDFKTFKKHVDDIAWETEVWLSEIPNHMIHFNGDKFLKLN
jgi:adenine-specific DNA-methyltransferase